VSTTRKPIKIKLSKKHRKGKKPSQAQAEEVAKEEAEAVGSDGRSGAAGGREGPADEDVAG
jgi:hypothetical protein